VSVQGTRDIPIIHPNAGIRNDITCQQGIALSP